MTSIFDLNKLNEEDFGEQIDIDDLYEKKKNYDLNKLSVYKKILSRIHVRIKTTSRQNINNQYCWYVVPEIIIGVPKYDHGACIAFLLEKLQENGFAAKYIHPNLLFISWKHWVPSYVREEIKKRTGVSVDGSGIVVKKSEDHQEQSDPSNPNSFIISSKKVKNDVSSGKNLKYDFKSTNSYSPLGIYKDELMRPFKK
tara:strand:- start:570 stop:1163 length:594 start_codon:yes stop_codon:yes gene_type:complete